MFVPRIIVLNLNFYKLFRGFFILIRITCFFWRLKLVVMDVGYFFEWRVFNIIGLECIIGLYFDWMCFIFLRVVRLISGSIFIYCNYYIAGEINYLRFIFVLLRFIGSMWLLIIRPNLIRLLLGWDGLGLRSYLLVIFYQNERSGVAGILTVLINRVGDVSILMGISLISGLGSFRFSLVDKLDWIISILVVLASITKRAQIPFSAWLPAAIAAPTPVSSLVHSSTLVTAGVYLLIRFNRLVIMSGIGKFIVWVGVLTIFISGLGANLEGDLKKVVALSTLSQLGLIFIILGWGKPVLAFFHLVTHALFKSSLFMCVGFIIHRVGGSQDSRSIRGLIQARPVLGICLGVTNMALCGFPFLAGFYSKDIILENMNEGLTGYILYMLVILRTGLTVRYSVRLLGKSIGCANQVRVVSILGGIDKNVIKSLRGLVMFSCIIGYFIREVYCLVSDLFILSRIRKFRVLIIILFSLLVSLVINVKLDNDINKYRIIRGSIFLILIWFLSLLSGGLNSKVLLIGGGILNKFDIGWLENYGGQGAGYYLNEMSNILQLGQKRIIVRMYLIGRFILGVVCLIFIFWGLI